MDVISLDGIDTTVAWRVESKAPVMEQDLDVKVSAAARSILIEDGTLVS